MEALTKAQAAILKDLRKVPKKRRTETGLVKVSELNHFDHRSVSGLVQRGFIEYKEYGLSLFDFGQVVGTNLP